MTGCTGFENESMTPCAHPGTGRFPRSLGVPSAVCVDCAAAVNGISSTQRSRAAVFMSFGYARAVPSILNAVQRTRDTAWYAPCDRICEGFGRVSVTKEET